MTQYNFTWNARLKFTAEQTSEGRHNLTMLFSRPVRNRIDMCLLGNDDETDDEISSAFLKVAYRS